MIDQQFKADQEKFNKVRLLLVRILLLSADYMFDFFTLLYTSMLHLVQE